MFWGTTLHCTIHENSFFTSVTGTGWAQISVESLGPLAKLSANKVTYGTMSKIVLDATLSEDRDNSPGELKFIWSCLTSDGSGCFVYDGANPRRLEEALPSGYYLNPISLDGGDISL